MDERLDFLLKKLDENNLLNVNDVAEELHVSSATIRRDLNLLEEQGKVKRIPGGAVKPANHSIITVGTDLNIAKKMQFNTSEKEKICQMACDEIQDGECIFIDAGTSTSPMFKYLQNRPVTIVTNNDLLLTQINPPVTATIILLGGVYLANFALTFGTVALNQIEMYNFDRSYITTVGLDLDRGLAFSTEIETRDLKLTAMRKSKYRYLMTDQTKIGVIGFCELQKLARFDLIYCDYEKTGIDYPDNMRFVYPKTEE